MQFTTAVTSVLLAASSAQALGFSYGNKQAVVAEEYPVPGKNPLTFCGEPKDYILNITNVDLDPNPPVAGQPLAIDAIGNFSEDIDEGAKVKLQVKYGLITLINQEADLCDQVSKVDMKCPLKKGETKFTKAVSLPAQIPPGTYTVLADVYTKDDEQITCLQAKVTFHR